MKLQSVKRFHVKHVAGNLFYLKKNMEKREWIVYNEKVKYWNI